MTGCEHREVVGAGTLPANHKRIGFKSAAGVTKVCLIRGPVDAISYRTTGKVVWVEFPSPHNMRYAWHTIPVPVSQIVEL